MPSSSSWARAEELAGVGRWRLDVTTGAFATNQAALALLDWPAERGEPGIGDFVDRVHPEDRLLVRACSDLLLRTGQEYLIEHRVVLEDGRVLHLRASACADLDDHGRVAVVHGVTLDVTDLRRAALETTRERDRSRAVVDSLSDGYYLSAAGVIVEVNAALCRLTGFSEAELVGAGTPYPFWPQEDLDELLALRQRLVETGASEGDTVVQRKDGSRVPVAFRTTVVSPADGGPLWVAVLRDVTEERAHALELEVRAATDPLTGVRNSRAFREELRRQVGLSRQGSPLSLALLDIDHFKAVNDDHGHAVGDEVLIAVVQRLLAATTRVGTLARVGGEEFALLMPGLDASTALVAVAAALEELRRAPFPVVGTVTASAGVAQLLDGMDDDGLFRLADALMYEAKGRGRDQVR